MPVLVLALAVLGARAILATAPEAERREPRIDLVSVEATRLMPSDYPVVIRSQGTVQPSLQAPVVPQIAGTVSALSPDFVVGGAFRQGDVLVRLDERESRIALARARANLAQAKARLSEELALAASARADWQALGRRGEPSPLTLREPQSAAAQANRDAAQAELERAELDLERTRLLAPFDGRVLSRDVDVGQFVNRGTPLGSIHSIDGVEVRLPISSRQLEFLSLPANGAPVQIESRVGSIVQRWDGALLRAEGIDAATQQLNVIAYVPEPFKSETDPLRVGRYVDARIQGDTLESVFVIPRGSVREQREVLLLDAQSRLQRQAVQVAWTDDEVVAVTAGLAAGDVLVLTPLATVADGTPVTATIDGVAPPLGERGSESPES